MILFVELFELDAECNSLDLTDEKCLMQTWFQCLKEVITGLVE